MAQHHRICNSSVGRQENFANSLGYLGTQNEKISQNKHASKIIVCWYIIYTTYMLRYIVDAVVYIHR